MDLEALEAARALLLSETVGLSELGRQWRAHAAAHLAIGLDTELRGGVRRWAGDDEARMVLRGAARDLTAAADALEEAAARFRSAGLAWHANRTYHAAQTARRAGEALAAM